MIYNVHVIVISPDEFLTTSYAEGLRVTLHSTLDLSKYSSGDWKIKFVLTGKINQVSLDVFSWCDKTDENFEESVYCNDCDAIAYF